MNTDQIDLARLADLLRQAAGLSVSDVLALAGKLGYSADEYDEGAVVVWVGDREDYLVPQGDRWVLYAPGDMGPSVVVQGADGVWREVPEGEA